MATKNLQSLPNLKCLLTKKKNFFFFNNKLSLLYQQNIYES